MWMSLLVPYKQYLFKCWEFNHTFNIFAASVNHMRVGVRTSAPTTLTALQPSAYDVCATIDNSSSTDTVLHFECKGYPRGQYVVVQKGGKAHSLMVCEITVIVEGEFGVTKGPSVITLLGKIWIMHKCKFYHINHGHVWQVSLHVSCRNSCQIWMWYSVGNLCLVNDKKTSETLKQKK